MTFELKQGLSWLSLFFVIFCWGIIFLFNNTTKPYKWVNIVNNNLKIPYIIIGIMHKFILNLPWVSWLILIMIIGCLSYSPSALRRDWRIKRTSEYQTLFNVISWFVLAIYFLGIGSIQRSPIWLVGFAIIAVGAVNNLYFELAIKDLVKQINPKLPVKYIYSGLMIKDEFAPNMTIPIIAFAYFPILYLVGNIDQSIITNFIIFNRDFLKYFLTLATVMTTGAMFIRYTKSSKKLREILKRAIIGLWMIITILIVLSIIGSLIDLKHLNLTRNYLFGSSQEPLFLWLLSQKTSIQIWLASILTLSVQLLLYLFITANLVMSGRKDK